MIDHPVAGIFPVLLRHSENLTYQTSVIFSADQSDDPPIGCHGS